MRLAGHICVRVRRGRRRVAGPTQAFLDAALAQIRPVPKGSGQIGPLPRCSSSNMPRLVLPPRSSQRADRAGPNAQLILLQTLRSVRELVMRLAGRICVRVRRGRRRVAGPTQAFLDTALAQIRLPRQPCPPTMIANHDRLGGVRPDRPAAAFLVVDYAKACPSSSLLTSGRSGRTKRTPNSLTDP